MKLQKVLVVDDEHDARRRILESLEQMGEFEASQADSYEGALKLIAKIDFDGAVLDVNLDKKNPSNRDGFLILKVLAEETSIHWTLICAGSSTVSRHELDQYRPIRVDYIDKGEWTYTAFRKRIDALQRGPTVKEDAKNERQIPSVPVISQPKNFRGRLLIVENTTIWLERIAEVATTVELESVTATSYEEALGVLKREQVDGITLDMNLMKHEWIPRGDRSYESAYKLLELADQMEIPTIIITRFAGSVDDEIYDRFKSLKRIIFKDEIWESRLQQALEKHILSSKSFAALSSLPRKSLRKAVQSVLHYRFGSHTDLERAEPIERLADALQKTSQEIAAGLRTVTLQVFEEYTKSCEEFELEIKGLSSSGALRKVTTTGITEHILLCVEAKYEKEPNVNEWRPPFWSAGTLVEQLWPPKFERFKWWLVMNAQFGPYDRSRMEAALKVLLPAPGRTFGNYQNNGLNELLDEVDERRDRWLTS